MKEALGIGDDVLRLLERADRPPAAAGDRVWDAIETTLDGPSVLPPPPPPTPVRAGPGKVLLASIPLLLLAGTVGFWVVRSERAEMGARHRVTTGVIAPNGGAAQRVVDRPVVEPSPAQPSQTRRGAVPEPPTHGLTPTPGAELERAPAEPSAAPAPSEAQAPSTEPSTAKQKKAKPLGLEDELALMAKAREALHGGNHKKALRLLAEHASSFKRGVFAEERDFSRVVAACELEDVAKAKRFAGQYRRAHPKGALGAKLGETCAGEDSQ